MTRAFLLFSFLGFAFSDASAQNYAVTGLVTGPDNQAIESGNVILLSTKDSSVIKGDFFLSGQFRIVDISENGFILKLTSIGYKDRFYTYTRNNSDTLFDLGKYVMEPNNLLKEVEVSSKLPLFERDGEKTKVNVENSALSAAGTALDILRKSPTVMVDNSDNVSVFGKGNAVIYIDGQRIASNDLLKSVSSTEIKNIEIISNPSAKYDAAGQAVINIVTKKNNLEGYSGNLIQNTLYGKYLFTYSGLRFNYKSGKWSTYFGYGFPHGKGWESNEYYRSIRTNDTSLTEMKNKIFNINDQVNCHNYWAGISYHPDSSSTVSFQYNGFHNENRNLSDNSNDVSKDSVPQATILTYTVAKPASMNNNFSLSYSKKLDTLESEFSVTGQYGNYVSENYEEITQRIITAGSTAKGIRRNTGRNNISILTGQADLNKSFNKKWRLESGIKNSFISNESGINFESYTGGDWISDPAYFNGFNYSEDIAALYTQLRYSKNKLNIRAGVRAEYTKSDGISKVSGNKVIDREYTNVFPSAFFGYDFSKDLNTSITYSSRISRPGFQDMDPFINYIDSLSSFRGNPYLLPSYTSSFEASLIYMKEASLTFSYSRTDGAINLVVDKLDDGSDAFIATNKNLDYSETYSAGITIPYELDWWTTYNYFGYLVNNFAYSSRGTPVQNKKPMFYMYLYDEFRLKKLFSMEITFEYTGAGVDGIFNFEPFYELSANIKKSFFKDKLVCRFIANDILSTNFEKGASNVRGYNVNYINKSNSHYFALALNYSFGKLKSNDFKDRTVNREEYDRIKMNK